MHKLFLFPHSCANTRICIGTWDYVHVAGSGLRSLARTTFCERAPSTPRDALAWTLCAVFVPPGTIRFTTAVRFACRNVLKHRCRPLRSNDTVAPTSGSVARSTLVLRDFDFSLLCPPSTTARFHPIHRFHCSSTAFCPCYLYYYMGNKDTNVKWPRIWVYSNDDEIKKR